MKFAFLFIVPFALILTSGIIPKDVEAANLAKSDAEVMALSSDSATNDFQSAILHWSNFHFDSAKYYYEKIISEDEDLDLVLRARFGLGLYYLKFSRVLEGKKVLLQLENSEEISLQSRRESYISGLKALISMYENLDRCQEFFLQSIKQFSKNEPFFDDLMIYYIDFLSDDRQFQKADSILSNWNINQFRSERGYNYFSYQYRKESAHAYLLYKKGDFYQSISKFKKIMLDLQSEEHWKIYARAKCSKLISYPYRKLGLFEEAYSHNLNYLSLYPEAKFLSDVDLAQVYSEIAKICRARGNYDLYLEFRDKSSSKLLAKSSDKKISFFLLFEDAARFINTENYSKAIDVFYELEDICNSLGSEYSLYYLPNIYFNLSTFLIKEKRFEESLSYFNKFMKHPQVNQQYLRGIYLGIHVNYLKALPSDKYDSDIMLNLMRQFESTDTAIWSKNYNALDLSNEIVAKLIESRRYDSANFHLNFILNKNSRIIKNGFSKEDNFNFNLRLLRTYTLLVDTHLMEYPINGNGSKIEDLYSAINTGVTLIRSLNKNYYSRSGRARYFQYIEQFYHKSYSLYSILEPEESERFNETIFSLNQLVKGIAINEAYRLNSEVQKSGVPDSIWMRISELKRHNSFLKTQIDRLSTEKKYQRNSSNQLGGYENILLLNHLEYDSLIRSLNKNFSNYYEISYNQHYASIKSVQDSLDQNEALLEYFISENGVNVFVISKDTSNVFSLGKVPESEIRSFQEVMQPEYFSWDGKSAYVQYVETAHSLYLKLLDKPLRFLKESGINKLYIIPDKSLNYLPFELLIQTKPQKNIKSYTSLDYLLKHYSISYAYSSSILFRRKVKKGNHSARRGVLALAPSYTELINNNVQLAKLGKFRDGFAELKFNKMEVDGINEYFEGEVLKGKEATEKAFSEKFKDYDVLHLAMHALVDNDDSEKSRLVFAPQEDSIYDSYLHNFELYNLSMNPRMAVLSACNTGYGSLRSGEGVMSLARAFTYAGAESVVMSHWRVDDKASSEIMKSFYKFLAEGNNKDEALRQAKLEYLENAPATGQHPFHWNNFVIIGDISPLQSSSKWYENPLLLGLVAISLLTLLWVGTVVLKIKKRI